MHPVVACSQCQPTLPVFLLRARIGFQESVAHSIFVLAIASISKHVCEILDRKGLDLRSFHEPGENVLRPLSAVAAYACRNNITRNGLATFANGKYVIPRFGRLAAVSTFAIEHLEKQFSR